MASSKEQRKLRKNKKKIGEDDLLFLLYLATARQIQV
jgi:hypothetical protein